MDAAWELGITWFDTADAYGGGRSEEAIGRWCRSHGLRPEITTKTYNPMSEGADWGLSPERIERQLRSSLGRLGVDRVELYLAHEFDPDVPLEETVSAFDELVGRGAIGAYGVSNFDARRLERAAEAGRPACVENSCALLDRADEREVPPARRSCADAFGRRRLTLAGGASGR
jgi:aryl-alcohol dehydrogenase-like predicted oxidoreductase